MLPTSSSTPTAPPKLISDSALLDRLNALPGNGSQARAYSAAGQAATGPLAEQAQIAEPAGTIEDLPSSSEPSAAAEQEGVRSDLMQPAEAAAMSHADQTDSGVSKAKSAEPSQPAGLTTVMAAAAGTQLAPEHAISQSSLIQAQSGGCRESHAQTDQSRSLSGSQPLHAAAGTEAAAVEASAGPQPQPVHSPATTIAETQSTGLVLKNSTAGPVAVSGAGPSASGLAGLSPIEQRGSPPTEPHLVEQPPADRQRIAYTTAETLQRPYGLDETVKVQGHAAAALAVQSQIE